MSLTKLIIEKTSANLNLIDLFLSCLEFASPQIANLILDKCSINDNDVNQRFSLSQRLNAHVQCQEATLFDCFLFRYMSRVHRGQRKENSRVDSNKDYQYLLDRLMGLGFKVFNLKMLEHNCFCQTILFYDLKGES